MNKGPLPEAKASREVASVLPSRIWWTGACALWFGLRKREKALVLLGVILPAMEQLAKLGSLGVAMKAVSHGVRGALSHQVRIELCVAILVAFSVAAAIQFLAAKAKMRLRRLILLTARKCQTANLVEREDASLGQDGKHLRKALRKEQRLVMSACVGIQSLIDFSSAALIVAILLVVVIWFNLAVGAIMLASGAIALFVLRARTRQRKGGAERRSGKKQQSRREIAAEATDAEEDFESIENDMGKSGFNADSDELDCRSSRESKIAISSNIGIAVLMAASFYLVSEQGAIDEKKAVWIFVFVLGLRLVAAQGKAAISKWGRALSEKKGLLMVAKGALSSAGVAKRPQASPASSTNSSTS